MKNYLIARLLEGSTLRGAILLICGLAGYDIAEEQAAAIANGAIALAGLAGILLPDKFK